MNADRKKSGWSRFALAIVAMIIVVGGVNLSAYAYLKSFPVNRGVNRVWQKWQLVERLERPVDYLLLGDSSCTQGLRPDVLARELGGTVLNLCTMADASIINDAWLLDRYIQRMGPPRGVIVFHVFHGWNRPIEPFVAMFDQIPLSTGFWRRLQPALDLDQTAEARLLTEPLTTLYDRNLSASFVAQQEVAAVIGASRQRVPAVEDLDFVIRHQGWVPERDPRPDKVRRDTIEHIRSYGNRRFVLDASQRSAIAAMADMSEEHNFRLYMSHGSIARALYADPGIQRYLGQIATTIEPMISVSGHGAFVFRTPPQFEPEQMNNVDHVVGDEATTQLSQMLAAEVRSADAALDARSRP